MRRAKRPVWFILRREPYYHKIQYSKTPKFDIAAAVFGVAVGAFVIYLTLASVGSGGSDMSDLTALVWYSILGFQILRLWLFLQKTSYEGRLPGFKVWLHFTQEVSASVLYLLTSSFSFRRKNLY